MNKNSIKDFRPEVGGMDKIRRVLKEEGVYMGRGIDFDIYNFGGCTFFVYQNKIRIGGRLPVTTRHFSSQLEKKADIKLEEIEKKWE